jgi:hypothetical protein
VYTVQRVRVARCDRECRSIVDRPPTAIDIDSAPSERVVEVEFDGPVSRAIAGESMDRFRASVGRDEDLRAIATLAATHSAGPSERVLSQRASIERVSIGEVVCAPDVVVHLVGPERRLSGERALRTGAGLAVVIVTLVLGVIAIFAGSVLR